MGGGRRVVFFSKEVKFHITTAAAWFAPVWPDFAFWHNFDNLGQIFVDLYSILAKFGPYFGNYAVLLGKFSMLLMTKYFKIIYPSGHTGSISQRDWESML